MRLATYAYDALPSAMTRSSSRSFSVAFPTAYKFTGKERDAESGLDEFGARYYASTMGRFMIPDWSAAPTSVPYASLPYPQSLNLYSYVQNNPLSRTDPDGHCDVDGEHHGGLWCAAHALGFTETKKEYAARIDYALKHPITPAQSAALQGENAAVSIIMIGMAGGWPSHPMANHTVGAPSFAAFCEGWVAD
jgi:RHS repeat-associated protein